MVLGIRVLPDRWRVALRYGGPGENIEIRELKQDEQPREGEAVFILRPLPPALTVSVFDEADRDRFTSKLVEHAADVIVGWEKVYQPDGEREAPFSREAAKVLPHTILLAIVGWLYRKTMFGMEVQQGNPPSGPSQSERPGSGDTTGDQRPARNAGN